MNNSPFQLDSYLVRRKVLKLFGGAFHVFDPAGQVIGYSKLKAFKLKEDIRLFSGEDMRQELLVIQARQVIDFSASYDVVDPVAGQRVGALRRKGLKSMFKDEWVIMDTADQEIGLIQEQGTMLALVRRFIELAAVLFPQKYTVTIAGQPVALFAQTFNPFVFKLQVNINPGARQLLDPRLALAGAILMAAIEGKQRG